MSLGGIVAVEPNNWSGITYDASTGRFLVVASDNSTNTVMLSSDGINWTSVADPMNSAYHEWTSITSGVATSGISSGEMTYVAVSPGGSYRMMYSVSGSSWSLASAQEMNGWHSVTYGDGKFVTVSYNGSWRVAHSTDGYTWTLASAAENNSWQEVCYGNGKFVAVASSGTNRVMWSTNGTNWYAASAPQQNGWKSITYGDGKFVAVAFDGTNRVMYLN